MDTTKNGAVTILHTNDIHGRTKAFRVVKGSATSQTGDPGQKWDEFEREGMAGGFPALATAVQRIRQERGLENVLLVDGGDTFSDDLLGNLTRGEAVIRLMKALGYQLLSLGNHDFDYGTERTRELEKIGGFPMRAANVIEKATGRPFLGDPTLVLEAGGLRIGLLTLGYHNSGLTGSKNNLEPLEFTDGVEAVRHYLDNLKARSDFVVILSHMGTAMDRVLAEEMPEVKLIIGAHSHDRITDEKVGETMIVQAVSDASVLGEIVVRVENGKLVKIENRLHTLWNGEYPDDPATAELLEELRAPYKDQLEEVIGEVLEPISRNYRSESPFDKLAGELMCQEMDAEIAFLPGVGYGITLQPGPLTREALFTLVPHPAELVTLELSGRQVLELLEQSATNQDPGDPRRVVGGLLQTAGISWIIDYNRPSGSRVSGVSIRGQDLDSERFYHTVTNSGMLSGLHNYTAFSKGRNIQKHDLRMNELIESAISKMGSVEAPALGDITLVQKD